MTNTQTDRKRNREADTDKCTERKMDRETERQREEKKVALQDSSPHLVDPSAVTVQTETAGSAVSQMQNF
jgi:hypothetical protein